MFRLLKTVYDMREKIMIKYTRARNSTKLTIGRLVVDCLRHCWLKRARIYLFSRSLHLLSCVFHSFFYLCWVERVVKVRLVRIFLYFIVELKRHRYDDNEKEKKEGKFCAYVNSMGEDRINMCKCLGDSLKFIFF